MFSSHRRALQSPHWEVKDCLSQLLSLWAPLAGWWLFFQTSFSVLTRWSSWSAFGPPRQNRSPLETSGECGAKGCPRFGWRSAIYKGLIDASWSRDTDADNTSRCTAEGCTSLPQLAMQNCDSFPPPPPPPPLLPALGPLISLQVIFGRCEKVVDSLISVRRGLRMGNSFKVIWKPKWHLMYQVGGKTSRDLIKTVTGEV